MVVVTTIAVILILQLTKRRYNNMTRVVKKMMNEIVEDWNERITDGEDERCLNDRNK